MRACMHACSFKRQNESRPEFYHSKCFSNTQNSDSVALKKKGGGTWSRCNAVFPGDQNYPTVLLRLFSPTLAKRCKEFLGFGPSTVKENERSSRFLEGQEAWRKRLGAGDAIAGCTFPSRSAWGGVSAPWTGWEQPGAGGARKERPAEGEALRGGVEGGRAIGNPEVRAAALALGSFRNQPSASCASPPLRVAHCLSSPCG